jgi:hypothetical protein
MNDKILKAVPNELPPQEYRVFIGEVSELKETDFKARYILEDLDLISWALSKETGKPMIEVVKENHHSMSVKS